MRILVIGHGMVGSRFAADLVRADLSAEVTVLGQEDHAPYNRVMLSSVVAGKVGTSSLALEAPDPARVRVLRGVRAVRLDRDRREVLDDRGTVHPYDRLVLATGSAPRIPAIPGLREELGDEHGLLDGVSALKDLADAHRILAVAERARQAVVLGAGVLGLEVATGLAARGISVTLVHHRDRLLERQLDPDASAIMHGALGRLGIEVVTGVQVSGLERAEGRLSGVRLSDGGAHPAQLMVLCTGTVPHLDLAREAGLTCEDGILVGEDLAATEDSSVFAIGDCAQPPEGASGLVAQGWEQARRLVAAWTAADAPGSGRGSGQGSSRGSTSAAEARPVPAVSSGRERDLVRVKTVGLPVVTMGRIDRPGPSPHAPRSVRLSDPLGGRYTEVVVHDGRLIAATVIGDEEAAASLSATFTQRTPVPLDPIHLLARPLPGGSAPAPSPHGTAEEDVVCRCNGVTRGTLCAAVRAGCGSMAEISARTRAGTGCGTCRSRIAELLEGETAAVPLPV